MKNFTNLLLAASALALTAGAAHADMLSDLKVKFMTVDSTQIGTMVGNGGAFASDEYVHAIVVSPTADAPAPSAPATVLAWSGYVRVGLAGGHDNAAVGTNGLTGLAGGTAAGYPIDLLGREKLKVVGSTETALGTIGASVSFRTNNSITAGFQQEAAGAFNGGRGGVSGDGYYGWLKTGNITFSGGNGNVLGSGSLVYNTFTFDSVCTCMYGNDNWGAIATPRNGAPFSNSSKNTPMMAALSYQDGPIVAGAAIEDAGGNGNLGFSGKVAYNNNLKAGAFGAELSGGYWGGSGVGSGNAAWAVIGGVAAKYDPITLGLSLGTGNTGGYGAGTIGQNAAYTIGNAYASVGLTSDISAELALVHDFGTDATDILNGASLFEIGAYWKPQKQFVLGLEGQFQSGGVNDGGYTAAAVTRWSF